MRLRGGLVRRRAHPVKKFFGTPKGLLIVILSVLIAMAAPHEGIGVVAPGLLAAITAAGVLDLVILRARKKVWEFPSGAVLTAMIVAMVLSAQQSWWISAASSAVAVASKYVFRTHSANVFNPAGLGIVFSYYVFHTGQSWWGALPELHPVAQLAMIGLGIFIADRVNKMPLVLVFLGAYFFLFTATAFAGDPRRVAEIFRAPDVQAALFFALVILTDPPTSPVKYRDQVYCGLLVAAVSYAVFEWLGAVYFLLAGTLAGNAWEAWRRWSLHRARASRRRASPMIA